MADLTIAKSKMSAAILCFLGQNLPDAKNNAADTFSITRTRAAQEAGLSVRQQVTAVRVANVPHEAFEAQVESEVPPTVNAEFLL